MTQPDVLPRLSDPKLIRDRVVDALRDAIIAGRLKPGARIRERELVTLLGVSRSPLREAIRILEGEGFIVSENHRGARVSELSAADLQDMVHVRIMLEQFAAGLVIDRLDDVLLRALAEQVRRARAAGRRVDARTNFVLAFEFHDLLVLACGNRKVAQLHENLKAHHRRYDHFAFTRLGRRVRAVDEHEQIVSALRRRDLATVQHLLRTHLLRFYDNVAPLLPVVSEVPGPPADARQREDSDNETDSTRGVRGTRRGNDAGRPRAFRRQEA
ncbi:MAG TPA: GntR family transcriptional regulator [Gaiellales bacterium]|nr:GntR family transcriptional regulator [Gaiellales bacterium]